MTINAGELRHRIAIEQVTEGRDTAGGTTEAWTLFAPAWAAVEPLNGKEFFAAEKVNAQVSHRVTMRYIPGIKPKMRVNHNGRLLLIEAALNIEERNRELHLMCREVV